MNNYNPYKWSKNSLETYEGRKNNLEPINNTKGNIVEILEDKYSVFGNPDEDQKKMIDLMFDDCRKKMILHKLKYTENTIEIEINGKKLVFDKIQPIQKSLNWDESMKEIKKIGRKGIEIEVLEQISTLVQIFYNGGMANLLGLDNNKVYWSTSTIIDDNDRVYSIYFQEDGIIEEKKINRDSYPLCIHS